MVDQVIDLARDLAHAYVTYCETIRKDGIKPVDFDTWMSMRAAMASASEPREHTLDESCWCQPSVESFAKTEATQ